MVKVGDKIRILRDDASGAIVNKGDVFSVVGVYDNGGICVNGPFSWCFRPKDFEVISPTPPQKIQQDGYEYELVGPVKPDWLVDGAWVVRKGNGEKYKVKEAGNNSFRVKNEDDSLDTDYLPSSEFSEFYRPHTPEDFKWGDWAMYEGKRVFVMGRVRPSKVTGINVVSVTHDSFDESPAKYQYVSPSKLTPTF